MSKVIEKIWAQFADVEYVSPSPGVSKRWMATQPMRADTDPRFNGQPWYHGSNFATVDPSQNILPKKYRGTK